MQARLLADPEVLVVLGLDTLQPNILSHDDVLHIAAARDEVATRPQLSAPEHLAELSTIHEQMVRRLPLNRLHDAGRSKMRRHAQQQLDMIRTHLTLQNLMSFDLQISRTRSLTSLAVSAQDRLRYFVINTK